MVGCVLNWVDHVHPLNTQSTSSSRWVVPGEF